MAPLRNQTFFSLGELREAVAPLLATLNERPFDKTEGSRRSWFEDLDRPALKLLPSERYEYAEWRKARVNIDYHIQVEHALYSVPHPLGRCEVDVRLTAQTVEIFHKHRRRTSPARSATRPAASASRPATTASPVCLTNSRSPGATDRIPSSSSASHGLGSSSSTTGGSPRSQARDATTSSRSSTIAMPAVARCSPARSPSTTGTMSSATPYSTASSITHTGSPSRAVP